MARRTRRSTKAEIGLFIILAAIGIPIALGYFLIKSVGIIPIIVLGILVAGAWFWHTSATSKEKQEEAVRQAERRVAEAEQRKAALIEKYHDESIVDKILSRTIWVGETEEQLRDSLGPPVDIDEKVLKTKKKSTWKYFPAGGKKFKLRVTLDNGVVVGWDEKQ